jgi:hypothetical protein
VALLGVANANDGAPPAGPGASLTQQLQRAYYHLYEGNKVDCAAHQELAAAHRQKAEALKAYAHESARKQKAYQNELDLAGWYTELSQHNAAIVKAFEQTVDEAETLAAMEAVPKLEQQIARLTGKPVAREWLTFQEVQARCDRGMEFKTEAPDILPYATHHWFWPDQATDGKREKHRIKAPRQEPPK